MKLLRVIASTDPEGGGPIEGIKQVQLPLQEMGVSVEIASCDAPDAPWHGSNGLADVHALGPSVGRYSYSGHLVPWLRLNAGRFDAVIVHGLWQYHGMAVRHVFAGTKTPYFVFAHGMLDPWFKRAYPLKHLKKWLYWPWGEYRVLRDARAVIFTSEEERLAARQSFWMYQAREAVTAYGTAKPPSDGNEWAPQFFAQHPQLKDKRIILFLSRIHEKKGCDLLIEAFARVAQQDERLHLVMAGPDQAGWAVTLHALAQSLGIAHRITWPGMLRGTMKWAMFHAADVFCLPSHQENFGIVVAEALACGKAVLISNKVNIWREIERDGAGFVAEDTVEGTFTNLSRWLCLSESDVGAMETRAVACFERHFNVKRAAEKLVEIIKGQHDSEAKHV